MRSSIKTLSATVYVIAMLTAAVNVTAIDAQTDLRQWTIQELPFPAYDHAMESYNLNLFIGPDGTQTLFADAYQGIATGNDDWVVVDLSSAIDDLGVYLDYVRCAVDSTGNIHFVALTYFDEILYGTNASGEWKTEIVDEVPIVDGGWSWVPRPKIIVDAQEAVHLCYHNMDDGHDLRYATNANGNWTTWSIEQALNSSSLYDMVLDADGWPHIAYWNYNTTQLMHVTLDGDTWKVDPITSADPESSLLSVTLDVSEDGRPHVAYCIYRHTSHEISTWSGIYYMVEGEDGWEATLIDGKWSTGILYGDVSGRLDAGGNFHLSYCDRLDSDLIYACNEGGTFERQRVDSVDYVGRGSALVLDSDENVHIAYLNETSMTVKHAFGNATTSSSTAEGKNDIFPIVAVVTLAATGIAALVMIAWRPP